MTDRLPRHGQQYDLRRRGFETRDARRAWPQFGHDLSQFGWPTLIAEQNFMTSLEGVLCNPSSDGPRSEHADLQFIALQHCRGGNYSPAGPSSEAVTHCDAVSEGQARITNHIIFLSNDIVHIEPVEDVLAPDIRAPVTI